MKYMGKLVRIELTRFNLPPWDNVCPFQEASLLSILSGRSCQSVFERVVGLKGSPRCEGEATCFAVNQSGDLGQVQGWRPKLV